MSTCKGCDAPIIWVETVNGKRTPIDAKPERRYVIAERFGDMLPVVRIVKTYTPHFATCPKAGDFRKDKTKG